MTDCRCEIYLYDKDLVIQGYFSEKVDNNEIYYIAPNPPDYRTSFNGSALPYMSKHQAYDNTPNIGKVTLSDNNTFSINISYPNSYYEDFTNNIIPPYVLIDYYFEGINKNVKINLDIQVPNRTIRHPPQYNEMFYTNAPKLEIRSQEKILRDSQFKNIKDNNDFWGLKPPF